VEKNIQRVMTFSCDGWSHFSVVFGFQRHWWRRRKSTRLWRW